MRPMYLVSAVLALTIAATANAQQPAGAPVVARIVIQPESLSMKAGDTTTIKVTAYDAQGNVVPDSTIRIAGSRRALVVSRTGQVKALQPGRHQIVASAMYSGGAPVTAAGPSA